MTNTNTMPTVDIEDLHHSKDQKDRHQNLKNWITGPPCLLCGMGLRASAGRRWLLIVEGGNSIVANVADEASWEDMPGFMALYPVGPTCARKARKAGVPEAWMVKDSDLT